MEMEEGGYTRPGEAEKEPNLVPDRKLTPRIADKNILGLSRPLSNAFLHPGLLIYYDTKALLSNNLSITLC